MKLLLLLLLLALPVQAQTPIVISGEERQAILDQMEDMMRHIKKLEDALDTCQQLRQS